MQRIYWLTKDETTIENGPHPMPTTLNRHGICASNPIEEHIRAAHGRLAPVAPIYNAETQYLGTVQLDAPSGELVIPVVDYTAEELAQRLADVQTSAAASIDLAAGDARARIVSPGALTDQEYLMAYEDALAYQAAGYQGEVPPGVQTWVDNNILGLDAQGAADNIVSTRDAWKAAAMAIRQLRLAGKKAVSEAITVAAVEATRDAAIDQLDAI